MNLTYPPFDLNSRFKGPEYSTETSRESNFKVGSEKSVSEMKKKLDDYKAEVKKAKEPPKPPQTSSNVQCS